MQSVIDGRYQIVHKLGEGGMGIVYEAIQLSVGRPVAIKVIRDDLVDDPVTARRFEREVRMLTRISHPNIVDVFDLGTTDDGAPYLVMEMLNGETLADQLVSGPMPVQRVCAIGIQLCDALAAAHERGVVHRDLKPGNIVTLDAYGDHVKVLDFGIAKSLTRDSTVFDSVTHTGMIVGTPLYMAPEAITGGDPEPRSDLYALGCILYEMLAGAPPFGDGSSGSVIARQLHDPPPPLPPDVPRALAALVTSLLAKLPTTRPASAHAVRERLAAIRDGLYVEDAPTLLGVAPPPVSLDDMRPTLQRLPPPAPRSYSWLVALVAGGLFGLLAVLVVVLLT